MAYHCRCNEEEDHTEGIRKPWLYETQNLMVDPLDINYRKLIFDDQEIIDTLLEDESMHFTERRQRCQRQDVGLEADVLEQYLFWTFSMHNQAEQSDDKARKMFLDDFSSEMYVDYADVRKDWDKLSHAQHERKTRRSERNDFTNEVPRGICDGV